MFWYSQLAAADYLFIFLPSVWRCLGEGGVEVKDRDPWAGGAGGLSPVAWGAGAGHHCQMQVQSEKAAIPGRAGGPWAWCPAMICKTGQGNCREPPVPLLCLPLFASEDAPGLTGCPYI